MAIDVCLAMIIIRCVWKINTAAQCFAFLISWEVEYQGLTDNFCNKMLKYQ